MAIVPAGKRRDQVSQGAFKNESFFASDLFDKIAITGTPELKDENPGADPQIDEAMGQGTLNFDRGMGQNPFRDQGQRPEPQPGQEQPGQEQPEQAQHSPFLTPSGEMLNEEDAQANQGLLHERQRIKQALQGSGFVMEMDNGGKDGTVQVQMAPQPGLQITEDHYEQLLQTLARIGINPTKITDPDPQTGRFSISYKTNVAPDKVMKPGRV